MEDDLKSVAALCNRAMPLDHFFTELLNEKTFGDKAYKEDLNLVEEQEEGIVGFICGVTRERRDEKIGYTKLLAVDPEFVAEILPLLVSDPIAIDSDPDAIVPVDSYLALLNAVKVASAGD